MIACCAECGAPLTPADLGYDCCLNCHWQRVFELETDPAQAGELRLVLYAEPGVAHKSARDRDNRVWERLQGDGQVWCAVCGYTLGQGWMQGQAGWLQTYVCAEHVDLKIWGSVRRA